MKKLLLISTLAVLAVACSTPKERYQDRQAEAREEYNESLKEAQEDFREEELDAKKGKAQDMIDESEDVNLKEDEGAIQVVE